MMKGAHFCLRSFRRVKWLAVLCVRVHAVMSKCTTLVYLAVICIVQQDVFSCLNNQRAVLETFVEHGLQKSTMNPSLK